MIKANQTTMYSEIYEFPRIITEAIAHSKQIDEVAAQLRKKDFSTVQVLGRGTSGNASLFLKYLIEVKLGILVADASPSTTSIYNSPIAMRNNLLIGMSQSGKSTDLVEFARTAIASGAYFVAMTNDATSPLAQLANHHIELGVGPELAVAATKSYSSELLHAQMLVDAMLSQSAPVGLSKKRSELLSMQISASQKQPNFITLQILSFLVVDIHWLTHLNYHSRLKRHLLSMYLRIQQPNTFMVQSLP